MRISTRRSAGRRLMAIASISLLGVALQPATVLADTASEVRDEILSSSAYARENLKDRDSGVSSEGALQFWSSGGLIQEVPGDPSVATYESFTLTPKHVEVITLEEGKSAVAMYYSEGSYQITDSEPVAHYMTRVTEVYVKEGDQWKIRAAHYSPIAGGSGTNQNAVD